MCHVTRSGRATCGWPRPLPFPPAASFPTRRTSAAVKPLRNPSARNISSFVVTPSKDSELHLRMPPVRHVICACVVRGVRAALCLAIKLLR